MHRSLVIHQAKSHTLPRKDFLLIRFIQCYLEAMNHYAVYETNHLLRDNFITILSSSPRVILHTFRMKLREDCEVYYIFKDHNCLNIHQFLNETLFGRMQGEAPCHKVIVLFEMNTKEIISNIIEEELELLKVQNIDELNTLGDTELKKNIL